MNTPITDYLNVLNYPAMPILLERLRDARAAVIITEGVLRAVIDKASADGLLIMRYGDLPEYRPYEEALEAYEKASLSLANYLQEGEDTN